MPPNSFKSDESFLKKLAVGAAGTKATMQRLHDLGFQPIELERGSSGFQNLENNQNQESPCS